MNLKYFAALLLLPASWWYFSPIFHTLPKPTGAYQVGTKSYRFSDFTMQCWYPTDAVSQQKTTAYGSPEQNKWQIKNTAQAWHIPEISFKNAFNFKTYSQLNTPLSLANQTYPVIIFLPGYSAPYDFYTTLLEDIASHGYILVAFNTKFIQPILLSDGKFIDPSQGDDLSDEILMTAMIANFKSSVNWLTQQNSDQASVWHNRINLSKLFVMGHSFGGSTAMLIAQQDKRIVAGINMDGWKEMKIIQAIPVPFLFLLNDTNFPGQPGKNDGLKEIEQTCTLSGKNCKIMTIQGAGHNSFFDLAFLKWPFNKFCDPGTKDPYKVLQNIRKEILEFLKSAQQIPDPTRPLALINLGDHPWILQAQQQIKPIIDAIIKDAILEVNPSPTQFPEFYLKQRHLITLLYSKQVPVNLEQAVIDAFKHLSAKTYPTASQLSFSDQLEFFGNDKSELVVKINDPKQCLPKLRQFIIDSLPAQLHEKLATKEHNKFEFAPHETLGIISVDELEKCSSKATVEKIRGRIVAEVQRVLQKLSGSNEINPTELFVYGNDFKPIFTQTLMCE